MSQTKIAAAMIVKNDTEVEMLTRCLNSVAPFVDGLFLTVTQSPHKKIEDIARRYGANLDIRPGDFNHKVTKKEVKWITKTLGYPPTIKEGDVMFDFGKARQANLESIPDEFDWMFWIDTDDILRNGELLKHAADEAYANSVEAVFFNYLYHCEFEGDQIKKVVIQHLRERLVRIRGEYRKVYKWQGAIHETIVQQKETKKVEDERLDVVHLSTHERRSDAITRNLRVLEHEIYDTRANDPRPIYYLGKAYYDLGTDEELKKAEKLIMIYLSPTTHQRNMSGWPEERAQAWAYLAEIHRFKGEHNNSAKALMNSLIEFPRFRSTYLSLALTCLLKDQPENARFWTILATRVPQEKSTLVTNPRDEEYRAYEVLYNSAIKLNKVDEAWAACQRLMELVPNDPIITEQWNFINQTRVIRDATKNYMWLASFLTDIGEKTKLQPLLSAAPTPILNNPLVTKLYQDVNPPVEWPKKSIAFFCGLQYTQWGPRGLDNPGQSFLGGSEEAIVYLTQELNKLGWKVTVYADPGADEGEIDGVTWLPYYKFNPKDTFDTLVYWRSPHMLDNDAKARRTYLWCHDVQNPVEFSPGRLEKIGKIIVLSQAHRANLPDVPDDKFLISTNGYFEHHPEIKPENNPKWCIWTSSYDRGLEHLLTIWPDVKKDVPEAELHIFYGWQLFETRVAPGNPERAAWKRKMDKLMEQDGVTHHGRIAQSEIEKWYKKCGIFSYTCDFYEINCISAFKAQLWGAVPVTTNTAALAETVQHGTKVAGDIWEPEIREKYKKELIRALKDPKWQEEQREKMMPWARARYSWTNVAKQWSDEFGGEDEES